MRSIRLTKSSENRRLQSATQTRQRHQIYIRIVRRCLPKDADERYQTIKDVAIELKEVRREMNAAGIDTTVPASRSEDLTVSDSGALRRSTSTGSTQDSLSPRASNAEYFVSGVKQHKLAAVLALVVIAGAATAPMFDSLHAEPEFTELVRQLNLPQ